MKHITQTTIGLLAAVLLNAPAHADLKWYQQQYVPAVMALHCAPGKKINQRQHRQASKIKQAKRRGQLTRWELHKLLNQQRRIRAAERHFRADRCLNRQEAKMLNNRLDRASMMIRAFKTNQHRAYKHHHRPYLYHRY